VASPVIAFNATPAAVQSAIQSIVGFPPNSVTVTGSPGAYTITLMGALAGASNALLTLAGAALLPANAATLVNTNVIQAT